MKYILHLIILFIVCTNAKAQNKDLAPIQIDRPDQTECSYIVPIGYFQMENGFNYERLSATDTRLVLPTSLWKIGITDRFELRLITEVINKKTIGITGINPIKIGFKSNLTKEKGIIPMISFIGHLSIPTIASENFKTKYYAPSFRFTLQHSLSDKWALGYNLGAEWDGFTPDPNFLYTLTTGYSWTSKLGTYIELFGYKPQFSKSEHRFDGGLTYLLNNNHILDLSAGKTFTIGSSYMYVSLGYSFRVKLKK